MITFTKKDKLGNTILVQITTQQLTSTWVNCTLYKQIVYDFWLIKIPSLRELFEDSKSISEVEEWDCERYEQWTDNTIEEYNITLNKDNKEKETINYINNGCNNA